MDDAVSLALSKARVAAVTKYTNMRNGVGRTAFEAGWDAALAHLAQQPPARQEEIAAAGERLVAELSNYQMVRFPDAIGHTNTAVLKLRRDEFVAALATTRGKTNGR